MLDLLWPDQDLGLSLDEITCSPDDLDLRIALTAATATCPVCQLPSTFVHSHYPRTLCDLPLANHAVHLRLRVRRFFCRVGDCPRRVFAEQLGTLARPYAHRTTRMAASLRQIGLALGGQAGSRLAADLQLPTSRDTLLRFVRLTPDQPLLCSPPFLGVDDFCWRRGQTYGTILVDLQSGRVVDLLPDREAATFTAWLRTHPGAEIISRDRASAYSEGARIGAPNARQAADRFHVIRNLADALEEVLSRLRTELRQSVHQPIIQAPAPAPASASAPAMPTATNDCIKSPIDATVVPAVPAVPADKHPTTEAGSACISACIEVATIALIPAETTPASNTSTAAPRQTLQPKRSVAKAQQRTIALSQSRRRDRLARYEQVRRLHELGWTQKAIASQVNLAPKTIARWLRHDSFPERQEPAERRSKLDGHKAYIRERCAQGCWNAKQMWRELTEQQGYRGGRTRVRDFVAELRQEHCLSSAHGHGHGAATSGGVLGWQLPSSRELKWLMMKPVASLDNEQYELVREVCRQSKDVTLAYGLVTDFHELVRNRRGRELANWVELALASGVSEMESFARGVLRDFAAVYTGMELEWNNGPVEGNVNRLKLFKRQGYGRAKFDLLRKRLLHAS
jgi:transposase